jgi:hypothetical protein
MGTWDKNYTMQYQPDTTVKCCGDDQEPKYCTVIMQCQKPSRPGCGSPKCKIIFGVICVITVLLVFCCLGIFAGTESEMGSLRETYETLSDDVLYTRGIKHVDPIRCKNCFQFNPEFLINNPGVCRLEEGHPKLLILVTSRPGNTAVRDAIRNTWGNIQKINGKIIKTVFLAGLTDPETTKNLIRENDLHHDLIQGSFVDTYRNLTYKSVMGLKWAAEYCGKADFVMKADDDTFIRMEWLMGFLDHLDPKDRFIAGHCFTTRPLRDKSSKWYIKESEYNDTFYPMYCAGQGYIISQTALIDIVQITRHVPFLYLEDVYITGMCRNAMNISYIHNEQIGAESRYLNDCDYLSWVIMSHYINHTEIIRLTRLTTDEDYHGKCTLVVHFVSTGSRQIVLLLSLGCLLIIMIILFCYLNYYKRIRSREISLVSPVKYLKQRRFSRYDFVEESKGNGKIHRL